jgi:ParB-like chromosome segregation protein Spo0J
MEPAKEGEDIIQKGGAVPSSLAAMASWQPNSKKVAKATIDPIPHREGPPYIHKSLWPLVVPIDSLKPDPANARKHGDRNLESIVASLNRFGQRSPIVVQREGMVVRAGNGRLAAAKSMGWQSIAAVIVDEASVDATAFAIADNRTSDLAEWDEETLASLLQSLPDDAREAAGYIESELVELLEKLGSGIEEVDAPDLPSGDKSAFQQMTFVVTDDQASDIKSALQAAKDAGPFVDTGNENSNGNALARISEAYRG